MHTVHRLRSWLAVLAFAALLFAPWPAEAAPAHPVRRFSAWLADLWADAGLIFDPNGATSRDAVGTPAEGLTWDPNGGAAATSTPPAGTDSIDAGLTWDPNGKDSVGVETGTSMPHSGKSWRCRSLQQLLAPVCEKKGGVAGRPCLKGNTPTDLPLLPAGKRALAERSQGR